jgi:hypothetical protein
MEQNNFETKKFYDITKSEALFFLPKNLNSNNILTRTKNIYDFNNTLLNMSHEETRITFLDDKIDNKNKKILISVFLTKENIFLEKKILENVDYLMSKNNDTYIIIYFLENDCINTSQNLESNMQNKTFKKICHSILVESYTDEHNGRDMSKDWKYYNINLRHNDIKNRLTAAIQIFKKNTHDLKSYYLIAKLTNNKKLFRAIINSIYMFTLLRKIPVSQYSGNYPEFELYIVQNTLPKELAYEILQFIDIDSIAGEKINVLPDKTKLKNNKYKNKIVPLNGTVALLGKPKKDHKFCEIL